MKERIFFDDKDVTDGVKLKTAKCCEFCKYFRESGKAFDHHNGRCIVVHSLCSLGTKIPELPDHVRVNNVCMLWEEYGNYAKDYQHDNEQP
jgi:hypothetical protein